MTLDELKDELFHIGGQMCLYPPEKNQSVYIRRSAVNEQLCDWAVRIKQLVEQYEKENRP